jgi:thiol-disulfide isomerase/thioredoxin
VSVFGAGRHRVTGFLAGDVRLPGFDGATGWLNSPPLTPADLVGKVVLVDFWTYTCINWLRTLAYIRAWGAKYRDDGLVVVGVHTPEFPFEHDIENVRWAAGEMRLEYPIAVDSDYAVWRGFSNHYWPAVYLADAEGRIRHHQFGEGQYDECEMMIQRLLRESGRDVSDELVSVAPEGFEVQADWSNLRSPETYLGYEQAQNFSSPGGVELDRPRIYVTPDRLWLNEWALTGDWTVQGGFSLLNKAEGGIAFRFHARDVNIVLAAGGETTPLPFHVRLDGEVPGSGHGLDVDERGQGAVSHPRLYQLIRQSGAITERTFEITFLAGGVEAYVFTFG